MTTLAEKKCQPCQGGVSPLTRTEAQQLLSKLSPQWLLAEDALSVHREFRFRDFYRTMSFVNALAHIAHLEDHHPDLQVGYNSCRVRFTTHTIKGLSENDFICAAKIDLIPLQ